MSDEMHPDLEWLARNVSEWIGFYESLGVRDDEPSWGYAIASDRPYTKLQWLQARQELGLVMAEEESELPAQEWAGSITDSEEEAEMLEELVSGSGAVERDKYRAYFKDVRHIDTIDVYRVLDLYDCDRHGHAIGHAAKKLLLSGRRTGQKSVEHDVREAIDALHRWLEMREEDKGGNQ